MDAKPVKKTDWCKTIFAAIVVIIGFTTQNVTIVYWTEAKISNFGILILCGMSFFVFFGILCLLFAMYYDDWTVFHISDSSDAHERWLFFNPWRRSGFQLTHMQILCSVGFLNSLNGFLIVYASPPDRTPPLIQAIFQNAGVLFSVPFSKFALGDKKKYFAPEPLLAAGVILSSVAVSLAPTIVNVSKGDSGEFGSGFSSIAWCIIYLSGLLPSAAYNVTQQLYFIRAGILEDPDDHPR